MAALIFALSSDVIAEEVGIVKEGINPLFVLGMSWLMGEREKRERLSPTASAAPAAMTVFGLISHHTGLVCFRQVIMIVAGLAIGCR